MFRLGHQLYKGRNLGTILEEIGDGVLEYAPDRTFGSRFEQEDLDWYHWRGLRYMLYEYEQHLAEQVGQAVRIPWEELDSRKEDTIEHILPQTIDQTGYWAKRFTPIQHRDFVHDIGNLTLTYDNSALGNKPFPEKRGSPGQPGCYAGSKLFVEQRLARYNEWTEAEISARREEIAEWAMARWHVEPSDSSSDERMLPGVSGSEEEEIDPVSEIQYVITRKFIPYGQMSVYHSLYHAGDRWVSSTELSDAIRGGHTNALGGVLGALGVRVNYTGRFKRERPGIGLLFEIEYRDGMLCYRMRPETRAAIGDLPGLQEVLTWPLEEIREKYEEEWDADWSSQRPQLGL
jgi:hypothetical protein